jgi:hypothetical protein
MNEISDGVWLKELGIDGFCGRWTKFKMTALFLRRKFLTFLAMLLLLSCTARVDAAEDPASELGTLAKSATQLSTATGSASDHFSLIMEIGAPGTYSPSMIIAQRDGNDVGLLVCSDKGLPYAYVRDGLLIMLDAKNPGKILVVKGIDYSLVFRSQRPPVVDFTLSLLTQNDKSGSEIGWFPSEIITGTLESRIDILADRPARTFLVHTLHRKLLVLGSAGPYPIGTLLLTTPNMSNLSMAVLGKPADDTRLSPVTLESLRALNVPIVEGTAENTVNLPKLIPDKFWSDPREVKAAESLAKILPGGAWVAEYAELGGLQRLEILQGMANDLVDNLETKRKIFEIFQKRKASVRADAAAYRSGQTSSKAVAEALVNDFDAAPELREVMTSRDYFAYAERSFENDATSILPEEAKRMILKYMIEAAKLHLSDDQEGAIAALCLDISNRTEQLRPRANAGELNAEGIKNEWMKLGMEMVQGLERILTDQQLLQMQRDLFPGTVPPAN